MSYFQPQSIDNYQDTNKENTLNKQTNPLPIKDNQYISGPHQPPQPPYLPPPYTQPPYLPPQPPQPTYYQPPPPQPPHPQPPPSQPPYIQPPRPIVVTIGPAVFPLPSCACRFCGREHILIASKKIGQGALIVFFLLLLICWPLCWLPFVIDDCKDKCYSCSQCGQELSHLNYSLF